MNDADELLDRCRRHLDPHAGQLQVHTSNAGTTVLRARTRSHGDVIVKTHRDPTRHAAETHAYRTWAHTLGDKAPRLLIAIDDPPLIVMTTAPGRPLTERSLDVKAEQGAHRRAGEILRIFHAAGPPRADLAWTDWLAERAEYWLQQAGDRVASRQRANVRAHMRALQNFATTALVPCHLDYTPSNLIYADDGHLRVIDFEHSRYDLAARDLVRFANRIWPRRPDLRRNFLDGHGDLTPADKEIIEHCTHLDALTALCGTVRTSV